MYFFKSQICRLRDCLCWEGGWLQLQTVYAVSDPNTELHPNRHRRNMPPPLPPLTSKCLKRARIGVFRSNGTEDEVFIGRVVRLILCQIMSDPFLQNAISQFQIVYFHTVKAFVQTEQYIGWKLLTHNKMYFKVISGRSRKCCKF